jgi:hypothetical protein
MQLLALTLLIAYAYISMSIHARKQPSTSEPVTKLQLAGMRRQGCTDGRTQARFQQLQLVK